MRVSPTVRHPLERDWTERRKALAPTLEDLVPPIIAREEGRKAKGPRLRVVHRLDNATMEKVAPDAIHQAAGDGLVEGAGLEAGVFEYVDANIVGGLPGQFTAKGRADQQVFEHRHAAERPRHLIRAADPRGATAMRRQVGERRCAPRGPGQVPEAAEPA